MEKREDYEGQSGIDERKKKNISSLALFPFNVLRYGVLETPLD